MISAIDSSVILDVITENPEFVDVSERVLRKASAEGKLVICETVLAEICPAFEKRDLITDFLADWQLEFTPSSAESAILAGTLFTTYLSRGGKRGRIVADFLIGAHATLHADRLVARDRGYLRDYFDRLTVLDPSHQRCTDSAT